eukprot:10375314-Heterocapsa_arctica.AAC.1
MFLHLPPMFLLLPPMFLVLPMMAGNPLPLTLAWPPLSRRASVGRSPTSASSTASQRAWARCPFHPGVS